MTISEQPMDSDTASPKWRLVMSMDKPAESNTSKSSDTKTLKPVVVKFNPRTAKKGDVIAHVVMQED
jgi:hypothetical protein